MLRLLHLFSIMAELGRLEKKMKARLDFFLRIGPVAPK